MVKARSLQDLGAIKQTLSQQAELAAARAAEKAAAERRAQAEKNLFQRAVGPVKPLAAQPRAELNNSPAPPKAFQQKRDDDRVLRESLSDDFDVSTLLDTDDELSYRRSGIGTDVTQKLRKGHWSLQGQIDLHGLRSDEAREALGQFIRDAWQGLGFARQNPGAQSQSAALVGAKKRSLGVCAGQRVRGWRGCVGGVAQLAAPAA
jgi:DNA-nicking Smr family endonuclease